MDRRAVVGGRDADRGVLLGGGGAADQQRDRELSPRHLLGDHDHLVQRRRDESRQADDVGAQLDCGVEDLVHRHHHAEIVDLVVVAREHDADDVLADIVHVALDGREHQLAAHALAPRGLLLRLHERLEVGDRALHRPRALDHLGQEHLARAEEVADHLHAVHQRTFDDEQRLAQLQPRLLGVGFDELNLSVQHGVSEPLFDGSLAPRQVLLALGACAGDGLRELDQPLSGVRPAIEDDVFDQLEQVLRNVLVDNQLAGVDDAHVQPGLDRVVEERRMDRLAHAVVAAE